MGRDATILSLASKRGIYIDRLYNLLPSQGTDVPETISAADRVRYEQLEERVNAMFGDGVETVQDPLSAEELHFLAGFAEGVWKTAPLDQRYHALWARAIRDFIAMNADDSFLVVRSVDTTTDFSICHGSSYVRHEGDGFVLEGYCPIPSHPGRPMEWPQYVVEAWSGDELLSAGNFTQEHGLVVDGHAVKDARQKARAQLGVAELLSCMSNMVPVLPPTEERVARDREQVAQLSKALEVGRQLPEGNLQVEGVGETISKVEYDAEHIKAARALQERNDEKRKEKWAFIVAFIILIIMGLGYQIVQRGRAKIDAGTSDGGTAQAISP